MFWTFAGLVFKFKTIFWGLITYSKIRTSRYAAGKKCNLRVTYLEYREWRFPWRRRQHWESVGQIPEADCRYEEDDRSSAPEERGPAEGNSEGDGPAAEGGRSSHLGPQLRHVYCRRLPGLLTNSILFGGLFKIKDQCKKVRFQQTHNQGLRQLLLTVSWDLRA